MWLFQICRVLCSLDKYESTNELWWCAREANILSKAFQLLCFHFDTLSSSISPWKWPGLHLFFFFLKLLYSQLTQFIPLLDLWCLLYAVRPQWGRYAQQVLAKPLGFTVCLVFLLHPVMLACVRFQAESSDYSGCCSCYFTIYLAASRGTEPRLHKLKDFQSSQDNYFKVQNIISIQNKSHRIHSWVFQRALLKCTWF